MRLCKIRQTGERAAEEARFDDEYNEQRNQGFSGSLHVVEAEPLTEQEAAYHQRGLRRERLLGWITGAVLFLILLALTAILLVVIHNNQDDNKMASSSISVNNKAGTVPQQPVPPTAAPTVAPTTAPTTAPVAAPQLASTPAPQKPPLSTYVSGYDHMSFHVVQWAFSASTCTAYDRPDRPNIQLACGDIMSDSGAFFIDVLNQGSLTCFRSDSTNVLRCEPFQANDPTATYFEYSSGLIRVVCLARDEAINGDIAAFTATTGDAQLVGCEDSVSVGLAMARICGDFTAGDLDFRVSNPATACFAFDASLETVSVLTTSGQPLPTCAALRDANIFGNPRDVVMPVLRADDVLQVGWPCFQTQATCSDLFAWNEGAMRDAVFQRFRAPNFAQQVTQRLTVP